MALIDSDNFIAHLIWSGLIDKATCGELKEAIELCTVKDVYTKADMVAILKELKEQLREMHEDFYETEHFDEAYGVSDSMDIIQEKINAIEENTDGKTST